MRDGLARILWAYGVNTGAFSPAGACGMRERRRRWGGLRSHRPNPHPARDRLDARSGGTHAQARPVVRHGVARVLWAYGVNTGTFSPAGASECGSAGGGGEACGRTGRTRIRRTIGSMPVSAVRMRRQGNRVNECLADRNTRNVSSRCLSPGSRSARLPRLISVTSTGMTRATVVRRYQAHRSFTRFPCMRRLDRSCGTRVLWV